MPRIERQLGTDDGEIESLALGERQERVDVARLRSGRARASRPMPALPGARQSLRRRGAVARESPDERMLAAAGADDEQLHLAL